MAKPPPRAVIHEIVLSQSSKLFSRWTMRTPHPLSEVLAAGFFDDLKLAGLRAGDLIDLLCDDGDRLQHAMLMCSESNARDRSAALEVVLLMAYMPMPIVAGAVEATESGSDTALIH